MIDKIILDELSELKKQIKLYILKTKYCETKFNNLIINELNKKHINMSTHTICLCCGEIVKRDNTCNHCGAIL